jgi:hypothetical protein
MADREKLKEVQCWRPKRQAALVVSLPKGENDRSGSGAPARAYGHAIALLEAENVCVANCLFVSKISNSPHTGCPCKLFGIYQPIALFLCFKALIRRLNVVADELSSARSFNEG